MWEQVEAGTGPGAGMQECCLSTLGAFHGASPEAAFPHPSIPSVARQLGRRHAVCEGPPELSKGRASEKLCRP